MVATKIPKILFQASIFKPPKYLVDMHLKNNEEWNYFHYNEDEMIEYILSNPIVEFPISLETIKAFGSQHKCEFFKYYYIYLNGGVYLESESECLISLNDIVKEYTFVSGISSNDLEHGGITASVSKNTIIYQMLKYIYKLTDFNGENQKKQIYKTLISSIDDYKQMLKELFKNYESIFNSKCKLYKRSVVCIFDGKTMIYDETDSSKLGPTQYSILVDDNNTVLLNYYYLSKEIYSNTPIADRHPESIKTTKIGITLDMPVRIQDLYCNGIRQNVYYLGELLVNIGYDFYFIINQSYNEEVVKQSFYDSRFKYIKYNKILEMDFDLVISIGFEMDLYVLKILREMKTKIISYNCGNSYIIDSETMLYSQHPNRNNDLRFIRPNAHISYDAIWSIPQMTNTNKYYWQTLQRTQCIEVPFIWSSQSINFVQLCENKNYDELLYKKNNKNKKIVIFEPNISIMKWCGPSLLVCENGYRKLQDKSLITNVFVNNIAGRENNFNLNNFNMKAFTSFVNHLDLCHDKKITVEGRFNALVFFNTYADIVVSHQWENNLNYLYFDLAWMGCPIVHNASLCQDVGYYYPEFNYEKGGEQIVEVIKTHDENIDKYIERNRKAIDKYLPTNKKLQESYIQLINNLFSPPNLNSTDVPLKKHSEAELQYLPASSKNEIEYILNI